MILITFLLSTRPRSSERYQSAPSYSRGREEPRFRDSGYPGPSRPSGPPSRPPGGPSSRPSGPSRPPPRSDYHQAPRGGYGRRGGSPGYR